MVTLALMALFVVFSWAASLAALRLGARWAAAPARGWWRCLAGLLLLTTVGFVCGTLADRLAEACGWRDEAAWALRFGLGLLLAAVVGRRAFGVRGWRQIRLWLPLVGCDLALLAFAFLIVRPFVFEGFIASNNSMAPTLVGPHVQGICPRCGAALIIPYSPDRNGRDETGICEAFHQTAPPERAVLPFEPPDRFCVNKLLSPRRWDVVAFRWPEDPTYRYAKRIVGLPGETIVIRDGSVWADGVPLEPPEALRGLEFAAKPREDFPADTWGSPERPARLGADEYFVLGDFGQASADSRTWTRGAAGHAPFAVPVSHFEGVVSLIYWPPSRWRVLR